MTSIALIANGDSRVGGGHIARSLTLGRALMAMEADVKLVVKPQANDILDGLWVGEFGVVQRDFTGGEINAVVKDADIICIDNYEWSAGFERTLGNPERKLVVIDDLANRQHDCDLLIDQNFGRSPLDYAHLVDKTTKLLIGLDYTLLRPEFIQLREASISKRHEGPPPRRVLVSLGATDVGGVTLRAVMALRDAGLDSALDVVVTRIAPSLPELEALAAADKMLTLHVEPRNIAQLMLDADAALGALGATTWERFCMGLPSVGIVLADNQKSAAMRLEAAGLVRSFASDDSGLAGAAAAVKEIMDDPALRRTISHQTATLVDGHGAERAAREILALCKGPAAA